MNINRINKQDIQIISDYIVYNDISYNLCESFSRTNIMDDLVENNHFISFINENSIIFYFKKDKEFYLIETEDTNITQTDVDDTIGLTLELILINLNDNQSIIAKVDTGADATTLRVERVEVRANPLNPESEQVRFIFNEKTYIKNVSGYHTVMTSTGEVEHRPYITLDVKFGDRIINNVDINLSTINGDQRQLLAGLNLLKELDYKIDVSESIILDDIVEAINNLGIIDNTICITNDD